MVVGNQESQAIQVMAIERRTGALKRVGGPVPIAAKPVAFVFYP
jgi:6-phosphogluconolactonase (cycloisomerase 2 family)